MVLRRSRRFSCADAKGCGRLCCARPRSPFRGLAMMGSRAMGAAVLGAMELSPAWWGGRTLPAPPALGRKKVFPVHLLTQSSWGDGEVGEQPAARRPAWGRPCPRGPCGDPASRPLPGVGSAVGRLTGVWAGGGSGRLVWVGGGRWLKQLWEQWRVAQGSEMTAGEMFRRAPGHAWLHRAPGRPFLLLGWQQGPKIAHAVAFPASPSPPHP